MKYADEIIVLSKDVQKYFMDTYGRETHFIPNGVNRPENRKAKLITDNFGLEKDSYILFLGRLVPEKGIRYLVEAFKNVKAVLKDAFAATCNKRGTDHLQEQAEEIIKIIEADEQLQVLWRAYQKKYSYAAEIDFASVISGVRKLMDWIQ